MTLAREWPNDARLHRDQSVEHAVKIKRIATQKLKEVVEPEQLKSWAFVLCGADDILLNLLHVGGEYEPD